MKNALLNYRHTPLILVILFALFACFFGISSYPLANNNEGLYAEVAREMIATHNYLIPHLNGVAYVEKPPLLYWLIAAAFHCFGITAGAARLIPAMGALITVLSLYGLSQTLKLNHRWQAALIFMTTLGAMLLARIVFFDMLLTAWLTLCLATFYHWFVHKNVWYLRASAVALALAVLTKGLVALVIALPVVLIVVPRREWRNLLDGIAIGLFLLIVVPWHVMASIEHPTFAWAYFINEHLMRFLNKRIPHDYYHGSVFYYLPRMIAMLLPWSLLLPVIFLPNPKTITPAAQKFLWAWLLVPLIFFSISSAKANYYMIVGLPPLVLLMVSKLATLSNRTYRFIIASNFLVLCGLLITSYFFVDHTITDLLTYSLLGIVLLMGIGYLLISGLCIFKSENIHSGLWATAGLSFFALAICLQIVQRSDPFYSEYAMANYIKATAPERPVYLYQDFEELSSLTFYLQKPLPLIDSRSRDLYYAAHFGGPNPLFTTRANISKIAQQQPIYVAIANKTLVSSPILFPEVSFCAVFRDHTATLLSNVKSECRQTNT